MLGKYRNRRERNQKKRDRKKQREVRYRNEKIGTVMPTLDENGDWTMKDNLQHRMIMDTINHKWDRIAGIRRRERVLAE